tara:strand:- start:51 stop:338 length:288 start_codon:yes stop_codon:yes gene_type:complete
MSDPKQDILAKACQIVADRGDDYGPPSEHFARTIDAINSVFRDKLKEPFTPSEWGMMMVIDKLAREQEVPKYDNLLDIIGYAACVHQCRSVEFRL